MGIGIYKELIFDSERSGDFGLYITGEGTFNAPARDVEMVTIPGRNGSYALDHGRFENIEVTYPAGVFGADEEDFADKIAEIRAWLCSKKGYVRLTDEYNPDEYRLAVYKSGLEVSPALLKAGEFDLVFDCMPQRFLTSGETPITIGHGIIPGTVKNPTRFESRPLLEVTGYGKITFKTAGNPVKVVEIISEPIGEVSIHGPVNETQRGSLESTFEIEPNYTSLHTGDNVCLNWPARLNIAVSSNIISATIVSQTGTAFESISKWGTVASLHFNDFSWTYGTPVSESATIQIVYGDIAMLQMTVALEVDADGKITITASSSDVRPSSCTLQIAGITGDSTKTALGEPLYLDLDIGEAYKEEDGEMISVNSGVTLGAELPTLKPGDNLILFDSTITDLKVTPRWWTV